MKLKGSSSPVESLVVHTRDVRYANVLIGLTDTHRHLVEATGINLMTQSLLAQDAQDFALPKGLAGILRYIPFRQMM